MAGPTGGTPAKPVGTVWMAIAMEGRACEAQLLQLQGDRESIRRQTVAHALRALNAALA
ncbi:MAG TPA: CinA family protein [Albitalea sp.]|nr:CinA family protein [Albitalea sp.]